MDVHKSFKLINKNTKTMTFPYFKPAAFIPYLVGQTYKSLHITHKLWFSSFTVYKQNSRTCKEGRKRIL